MVDHSEKFVSVQQAAAALKCSERTVLNYLNRGKLKGRKQGKVWRIDAETVVELAALPPPAPLLDLPAEPSEPFGKEALAPKPASDISETDDPDLTDLNGKKWSYRHLAAFNTLFPVVRDALSLLTEKAESLPEPFAARAIDSGLICLQRIGEGYHTYLRRDKVARYQEARDAAMGFSVALYLSGHLARGEAEGLKRYSVKVERAGARLSGLIRNLERKGDSKPK